MTARATPAGTSRTLSTARPGTRDARYSSVARSGFGKSGAPRREGIQRPNCWRSDSKAPDKGERPASWATIRPAKLMTAKFTRMKSRAKNDLTGDFLISRGLIANPRKRNPATWAFRPTPYWALWNRGPRPLAHPPKGQPAHDEERIFGHTGSMLCLCAFALHLATPAVAAKDARRSAAVLETRLAQLGSLEFVHDWSQEGREFAKFEDAEGRVLTLDASSDLARAGVGLSFAGADGVALERETLSAKGSAHPAFARTIEMIAPKIREALASASDAGAPAA